MKRVFTMRARALAVFVATLVSACGWALGIEDLRAPPSAALEAGADALGPGDDGGCRELETSCASDDDNCAYCGHRCGAGSHCVEHTCTPVEVAQFLTPFYGPGCALARDGARLFVAGAETVDAGDGGGRGHTVVRELRADGSLDPQPAVVVDELVRPTALLLDSDRFYLLGLTDPMTPSQSIVSCPRAGGGCTTRATSGTTGYLRGFARSARGLFATDSIGNVVWQIPLAPDAAPFVLVHDALYIPWDVVADDDAIYWSEQHANHTLDASVPLWRVTGLDLGDTASADAEDVPDAARVLALRDDLNGLASDGTNLVFGVDGGLALLAKGDGAITTVPIRDSARVSFATADETRWFAFVTANSTGESSLYERSRCGAKAVAVARFDVEPANAATLGDSVYVCSVGAPLYKPPSLLRVGR